MAKRNKLGEPKKKWPGTKYHRPDWERGAHEHRIAVPLALVGDARTFSMEGAVPEGDRPGDPRRKDRMTRWRMDVEGKSFHIYEAQRRWEWDPPSGAGDTYVLFRADRRCEEGDTCPLTRYWCEEVDFTLRFHRPGSCLNGVPGPGVWKRYGQINIPTGRASQ